MPVSRWKGGIVCLAFLLANQGRAAERGNPAEQAGALPAVIAGAEEAAAGSPWLISSMSESVQVPDGATLELVHQWGDVRIEASDTDRIHVTAMAQYHRDDPRAPSIRFSGEGTRRELRIAFADLEIADDPSWRKRRIDVGLLVPYGLDLDLRTDSGRIEVKKSSATSRLASDRGDIVYDGAGSITARTERGSLRALLRRTGGGRSADLSSLTGDLWLILLEGARADITLETRGTVTTDDSVTIERPSGSPLKKGRIRVGEGGTAIRMTSHSGGIRLQRLIVPEADESPRD